MKETLGVAFFVWKVAVSVSQVGAQFGAEDANRGFGKSASLGSDPSGEFGNNRLGYGLDNSNNNDGSNYLSGNNYGGSNTFGGGFPSNNINTDNVPYFYLSPGGNDYKFNYKVNYIEQYFGHEEVRVGDLVMGRYFVLLPDYRVQEVTYVADQNGYRATVSYRPYDGGYGGGAGGYGGSIEGPKAEAPPYDRKFNQVPGDA